MGPDRSTRHVLVIQDYITKHLKVIVVKGTDAESNITMLEEIFGRHGYPDHLVTGLTGLHGTVGTVK